MEIERLAIPEVVILRPKRFGDNRGFFSETWNRQTLAELGLELDFVQDNHSLSAEVGTIRGLHYQCPPFAQDKLVRVTRGRIIDVAVDLRRGSATYGRHVSAIVSAEEWNQILVPKGFAHGFCTLEPNTEVLYKVTAPYSPAHDRGIIWNDPDLAIDWMVPPDGAVLSDRDRKHPRFKDCDGCF